MCPTTETNTYLKHVKFRVVHDWEYCTFDILLAGVVGLIIPIVLDEWKDDNRPPKELLLKMGNEGFLACMTGKDFPHDFVDPGVQAPEDFDRFHELILYDELARCGSSAVLAAITNGPAIALSAIMEFGSDAMRKEIATDVLMGRKMIALAISEPNAGSDVAGLECIAEKVSGNYVLNGNKKWITNGTYADYFVTAAVTDPTKGGHGGLSLMLVTRDMPGFSVRKVKVRGSALSGTSYLDFDNVKVPFNNLIGPENKGFKLIMYNFNHERFYVTVLMCRLSRVCLEECIKYAMKRKTFGKYLYEHQAIRMKIAAMIRQIESLQSWIDTLCYQMCTMTSEEAREKIGDLIGLLKVQGSKVYEYCARETTMIFGGNALYEGGVGSKIEPSVMMVKFYQIPAGAEDILDDYGARTVFKNAKAKL